MLIRLASRVREVQRVTVLLAVSSAALSSCLGLDNIDKKAADALVEAFAYSDRWRWLEGSWTGYGELEGAQRSMQATFTSRGLGDCLGMIAISSMGDDSHAITEIRVVSMWSIDEQAYACGISARDPEQIILPIHMTCTGLMHVGLDQWRQKQASVSETLSLRLEGKKLVFSESGQDVWWFDRAQG